MNTTTCTTCETEIDVLAVFPGGICVDCYAVVFDSMPTQDIAGLFRGSINI